MYKHPYMFYLEVYMNLKVSIIVLMFSLPVMAMDEFSGPKKPKKPFVCIMVEKATTVVAGAKTLKAMAENSPKACCALCGLSCCCCPFASVGMAAWWLNYHCVSPTVGCVKSVRSDCCGAGKEE